MEVVYLISRAKRTGPVNQALNILIGLNRTPDVHAVLVTLTTEIEGKSWLQRFKDNNIEVVQLNCPLYRTLQCVGMLKEYVQRHDIDIVHSAGFRADFVNMLLRKHVKTVSTQRCQPNEIVEKFPRFTRYPFECLHLAIIKHLDKIVACSKSLQQVFAENYNIQVEAVQNGVNTDFFVPIDSNKKAELRKQLGIAEKSIVFIVLGRLGERKNVGLIVDAFLSVQNQAIRLLIVGSGPQQHTLEQKAMSDERIIFVGSTGSPLNYLQASDFLISSALAEGLPNTVLEALSCGLPCILSDISPHKELIEDSNAGILYDRFSIGSLKTAMLDSLTWDRDNKSLVARQHALKCFSIEKLAKNYEYIYQKLMLC